MSVEMLEQDPDFLDFARQIKHKTGLDLLSYKQAQVRRRLTSLKERRGYRTFADFYRNLERDRDVYRAFMDQLTINVTEFFRNPERWKVLEKQIAPTLVKQAHRVKCWSAACSTGEEPYSLVMTLGGVTDLRNIDVHATDLDVAVMDKAKAGTYSKASVQDVPQDKLEKYFHEVAGQYVVSKNIQSRVRFRQHNLLADHFETGYDLILCRNVLIYFTDEAKTQIYQKFAQSLKPGGYLFVGGTEQIMNPEQYGLVSRAMFFYEKQ